MDINDDGVVPIEIIRCPHPVRVQRTGLRIPDHYDIFLATTSLPRLRG